MVSYGSKNNYDRALKISEKANSIKLKVGNIDNKRKYKIAISLITAGVIAIGAGTIIKRNLKITEIPIYPEDSIESILQDYDIDGIQLIGEDNINFRPKYYDYESGVKIIHKRKEEDKINEITDERKNNHNPKTEYSFKYIVKSGDTVSGLQEVFEANKIDHDGGLLYIGEVVTIYTNNKQIAQAGEKSYEEEISIPELKNSESYVIKAGDTIVSIADKYGVSVQDILDYNPKIDDIGMITEGDTIIIPIETYGSDEKVSIKK